MAIYADIQEALETKLKAFADLGGYPVAWPNVKFTPSTVPYLATFNLPAQTVTLGLSIGSGDDHGGIYQIDVRCPKGNGANDSRTIVNAVIAEFSKGSEQTANTTKILIEQSWASGAFDIDDVWFTVPVSVRYRAIS